jgi:predicted RNA-binding protein YlqC (UPF0109 family)
MEEQHMDRDFIEYVVKSLVDHPDDVKAVRKVDEMGVLITLDVHPDDMGMVIGREGMTAKSLRTLLRVIGAKSNARVNLKINEPEGSSRGRERREEERTSTEVSHAEAMTAPEHREEPRPEPVKRTLDDVMNDIRL